MTDQPSIDQRLSLRSGPAVLAVGAWFKNTVCAVVGSEAVLTHPVGDLDSPEACAAHEDAAQALLGWIRARSGGEPVAIANDLHPDFHSTRVAERLARETGARRIAVQHHHAHIAAVACEHTASWPVLGLAIDGVGLGTDGTAWGGELLKVDGPRFDRLGGLAPLALPGGDRAAREPWRMAAAALHRLGRTDEIAARFPAQPAAAGVAGLLVAGTRCPPTSSLGRLFDAAAGLLGICEVMRFEAEAAIALERAAAQHGATAPLEGGWSIAADGRLDLAPLLAALAQPAARSDPGRAAALFHATLGAALADWVLRTAQRTGIATVAAGGGCLLNRLLSADLRARLEAGGVCLLTPVRLSAGDAAIAFGQAAVARLQMETH